MELNFTFVTQQHGRDYTKMTKVTLNISLTSRKVMNKLVFLLFIVALLPFVVGEQQTLGTFKTGTCVELLQTCSNCTYVNITSVNYPNSTQALGETPMGKFGTYYNSSFCSTQPLGYYVVSGVGDLNGADQVWIYNFQITPAGGPENNTTVFVTTLILAILLLVIAFFFENYIFAFLAGLAFLINGVYGMIYGFGLITNLYTQIVSYFLLGVGIIITLASAYDLSGFSGRTSKGDDDDFD